MSTQQQPDRAGRREHDRVLQEIVELAWAIRMHAEVVERYASLGHREGIGLGLKDLRACVIAAVAAFGGLRDA
jgi:hypothetical protein